MTKYKVWNLIIDGGDGEYNSRQYPSREAMMKDRVFTVDDEYTSSDGNSASGLGFDEYGYPVHFSMSIVDMSGYEVVND